MKLSEQNIRFFYKNKPYELLSVLFISVNIVKLENNHTLNHTVNYNM